MFLCAAAQMPSACCYLQVRNEGRYGIAVSGAIEQRFSVALRWCSHWLAAHPAGTLLAQLLPSPSSSTAIRPSTPAGVPALRARPEKGVSINLRKSTESWGLFGCRVLSVQLHASSAACGQTRSQAEQGLCAPLQADEADKAPLCLLPRR